MGIAIDLAEESLREDVLPIGAVIIQNGLLVTSARKEIGDHPRFDHAEIKALKQAMEHRKWANNFTLYTTLEPCDMCLWTLLNCHIGRIVYALEDPYGGGIDLLSSEFVTQRHYGRMPQITKRIMRENSLVKFQRFFETTKQKFWKENRDNPLVELCCGIKYK